MIPRLIHQIWLGPKPVPAATKSWERYCAKHNWKYRLWREEDLERPGFMRWLQVYERIHPNYILQSDIARLELLRSHGGVYIDCDLESSGEDMGRWVPLATAEFVATPDYREFYEKHVDANTRYLREPGTHALAIALHTSWMAASQQSLTIRTAWNDLGPTVAMNNGRIDFFTVACSLIAISISEPIVLLPNWLIMSGFHGKKPDFPHISCRSDLGEPLDANSAT